MIFVLKYGKVFEKDFLKYNNFGFFNVVISSDYLFYLFIVVSLLFLDRCNIYEFDDKFYIG